MTIVPCLREPDFDAKVSAIAEALKTRAHEVAGAGLTEEAFYEQGYFRAAIEKIRGQYAATMSEKRVFMRAVLNFMEDAGVVGNWSHAENRDRHDYSVPMPGGGTAVIEQKGCLDGNNVNISERPPNADEFYVWSLCTNQGSDIGNGIRSALMRITADMIATGKQIDGLIVWDMMCGQSGRPCPKLTLDASRSTTVQSYQLPPPCLYLFPATLAHTRLNPKPETRALTSLKFASALAQSFKANEMDVNLVEYEVKTIGSSTQRKVRVLRAGAEVHASSWSVVRRVRG